MKRSKTQLLINPVDLRRNSWLQKYLRHCTTLMLKWPVQDLVLGIPLHPLSKFLGNLEEQL